MKIGVLLLSDAIQEAVYAALSRANMQAVPFAAGLDGYVIAGDLSIEPISRFHVLKVLYPILPILLTENGLGKPILGIGQGAMLLVESGIVPGLENHKLAMGVDIGSHEYDTLTLPSCYQRNAFTHFLSEKTRLPIPNHTPAQFVMSDALLNEITAQGLNVFESEKNILAIANKTGNAMAVLPDILHHDAIFESMRQSIQKGNGAYLAKETVPLYYYPRQIKLSSYEGGEYVMATASLREALKALLNMLNIQLEVSATPTSEALMVRPKLRPGEPALVWYFKGHPVKITAEIEKLLKYNVLYNPYTHHCFNYSPL